MRARKLQQALSGSLLSAVLAVAGCADSSSVSVCSAGTLSSSQTGTPNFTLVPATSDLAIYPGQTTQIPVYIQPVNNATGSVTLNGSALPLGITMAPLTAAIGSTASLTVTAADNVLTQCFTGRSGVYSAAAPLTLSASNSAGAMSTQIALNVALENTSFVPSSTNLPIMTIATANAAPVVSEDDYLDATLTIADPTNSSNNYSGAMEIKGHGNSTWTMPKKPYRLNLDSKAALLGMASDTNWVLLANYDDKTMLRNDVSLQMSRIFGMTWTPSSQFVEVYLNGQYQGVYELTEKVEVSKARLNIGSIDDTDNSGTDLTGGYLAEIDHYDGETYMMTSLAGLPIGIYDPSSPTTEQEQYFSTTFTAAEASMYASNFTDPTAGWQAYWDIHSLAQWFLVEELAGNQDANDWSSDYFYKPRGDPRFYRGPVWDFDLTMGNVNYSPIVSPTVPWVSTQSAWYVQLFKDPAFVTAVKAEWTAMRPQIASLPSYIDQRGAALSLAAQNDHGRWPTFGEKVWPNSEAAGSYQGEINFMKSWLTARMAYMDSQYLSQ